MKFRGAGQGKKALVAEVIVGELARYLDLRVPRDEGAGAERRDRPLRGRRGGPGPAHRQHRPEPGHRLPARVLRFRRQGLQAAARGGRPDPVARCPDGQHRQVLAQPEPAGLAPQDVVHRPRRGPLFLTTTGRRPTRNGSPSGPTTTTTTSSRPSPGRPDPASTRLSRTKLPSGCSGRCWTRCPTSGWSRRRAG